MNIKIQNTKVLNSGWAGEIISLKLKDNTQKLVVKTYNSSKNGRENIKQEWAGLNILYKANYPVPKPIMINELPNTNPYIVMEEVNGDNFWTCYLNSTNEIKEQLLNKFVALLFKLHTLDISIVNNERSISSTTSFLEKEINDIKSITKENNFDYFIEVIGWLNSAKGNIIDNKLSIIHRDFHPWNVLVDTNGKLYVIDLLWDIGDYRFDLAWTCTLMERSAFKDFSTNVFRKYNKIRNENIADFDYFKVLTTLRWLVNVTISLKTGDSLNETRHKEFENFIFPLMQEGINMIYKITGIQLVI